MPPVQATPRYAPSRPAENPFDSLDVPTNRHRDQPDHDPRRSRSDSSIRFDDGLVGSFDLSDTTDIAQRIDGTFFLVNLAEIYNLDTNSGALTLAFSDTGQALAGAAFSQGASSDALFAYQINGTDDINRYSVDSAFARTTLFSDILPSFNAGRGDLASAPTVIPEPSTLLIAAFGALVLMTSRSRTHKAKVA